MQFDNKYTNISSKSTKENYRKLPTNLLLQTELKRKNITQAHMRLIWSYTAMNFHMSKHVTTNWHSMHFLTCFDYPRLFWGLGGLSTFQSSFPRFCCLLKFLPRGVDAWSRWFFWGDLLGFDTSGVTSAYFLLRSSLALLSFPSIFKVSDPPRSDPFSLQK